MTRRLVLGLTVASMLLLASPTTARRPIRNAFFSVYPTATGTQLDNLPSNSGHCGVCHFDFNGGGPRNPYGTGVEVARNGGLSDEDAVLSIDGIDSDNDGYTNHVEITDQAGFTNTPTFPGLKASNVGGVLNIPLSEVEPYLTPAGATDTTPPDVLVLVPDGGETWGAESTQSVSWSASDTESGVDRVDIHLSTDGGLTWKPMARGLANSGSWSMFVPNLPGSSSLIRVLAYDVAGNQGSDDGDATFTIDPVSHGIAPTTLRDFEMPGTQPLESGILEDPGVSCVTCHGGYDTAVEPWHNWRGSMMAHAARDPIWFALLTIVEQEAPSAGDLCLRCHTPGGWQEGRSTDTSGDQLTAKDRQSVQCDFCHRLVDPEYVEGTSPGADQAILDALAAIPLTSANGQFITDPDPIKRGPYADAQAAHQFLYSPYHLEADLCGTCHDVSNPVFVKGTGDFEYDVQALDEKHPDSDRRNMFPVERTYSEWQLSDYASGGVYAPQFAGDRPDGMVATCQDCHMHDVSGKGAALGPTRTDLALHDLTGGNHFIPDVLPTFYPDEVDATELADGKARAIGMLQLAASLDVTPHAQDGLPAITVRVTNETGHKLPSGYPEGRRIWLSVKAYDASAQLVYESGHYDAGTGHLTHDEDLKIYHAEPGISTRLGSLLGLDPGPGFHFALNDSIYLDNRIPPRGFTNADFLAAQAAPIGYSYPDGQYWDETTYTFPLTAASVEVALYYQSTSEEFITYLRDENETNSAGQDIYDAWVAQGRCAPVTMASTQLNLNVTGAGETTPEPVTALQQNAPNPFNPTTTIRYSLAAPQYVQLRIYDLRGRLITTLVQDRQAAGGHELVWKGRDDRGRDVDSGVYLARLRTQEGDHLVKMTLLR